MYYSDLQNLTDKVPPSVHAFVFGIILLCMPSLCFHYALSMPLPRFCHACLLLKKLYTLLAFTDMALQVYDASLWGFTCVVS